MKQIISVVLMITIAVSASAQKVRLNAYGASVFDESFQYTLDVYNYYKGRIDGGFQSGAGLEYFVEPKGSLELTYLRHDTHGPTTYRAGAYTYTKTADLNFSLNYLMLGVNGYLKARKGQLEFYGGLAQGIVIIDINNPSNGSASTTTKFAWSAKGGSNFWITNRVGLKFQSQFIMAVLPKGGNLSASADVFNTFSTIMQYNIGGGLTFKLGEIGNSR